MQDLQVLLAKKSNMSNKSLYPAGHSYLSRYSATIRPSHTIWCATNWEADKPLNISGHRIVYRYLELLELHNYNSAAAAS